MDRQIGEGLARCSGIMALTVALAVTLPGCSKKADDATGLAAAKVANSTDPRWVEQHAPHAQIAVVFVHGIFGDTLGTWTSSGTSFFDLLKNDPEIGPKVDLFAFGYTSNFFTGGSFGIDEAANTLYARLENEKVLDYPAIVFVNHSMGGLVVLRMLLQNPDVRERSPAIVFFGTPQEGAQITLIAKEIANNDALEHMLPANRNIFLRTMNDDWKKLDPAARPAIHCAYEKLKTGVSVIVPWESATRFCDSPALAIAENHIGIVKPDRPQHDSFMVVQRALRPLVSADFAPRLETPDFTTEGDDAAIALANPFGMQPARLVNMGRKKLTYTIAEISDPGLHLWPEDTPRELLPNKPQLMHLSLGFGARATEYHFKLRTDVSPERRVVVRVPNLPQLIEQQVALVDETAGDLDRLLRGGDGSGTIPDDAASDRVVKAVHEAVARHTPNLPESARWVQAAEILNALNWPALAARALREAERASPAIVKMPSVQNLANEVASSSGETRIFENATTGVFDPALSPRAIEPGDWLRSETSARKALGLANSMRNLPSLRGAGFSLQGDAQRALGDVTSARQSYRNAASIRPTPAVSRQLLKLDSAVTTDHRVIEPTRTSGTVDIDAPASAVAGSNIDVPWKGPNAPNDLIFIAAPDLPSNNYSTSNRHETAKGSPAKLVAPATAGRYEVRYFSYVNGAILARVPLQVTKANVRLDTPKSVSAGSALEFSWDGPNAPDDLIFIAATDLPSNKYSTSNSHETAKGSLAKLVAPATAGRYEVRYLSYVNGAILARVPLQVTKANVRLDTPKSVSPGSVLEFSWDGPNAPDDLIFIAAYDLPSNKYSISNSHETAKGSPAKLVAPATAGRYEVRYFSYVNGTVLEKQVVLVR
jgi:pimeloyl-ACP methyl ester carboxylesterase